MEHVLRWTQWLFKRAKVLFIVFISKSCNKSLSMYPVRVACSPSWELIRQLNCTEDLTKSPLEPVNDFLLIQALELQQYQQSKLCKVSAFNLSGQYLNFPTLPLFFFPPLLSFFWTLNYLIRRDFPSIKLLASLNAVASSGKMSNRQKSRQNSKWTVNGASLTHQQPGEREQTTNYCKNNYNIKNNNKKS